MFTPTREHFVAYLLVHAAMLRRRRDLPFDSWDGREVLCHLAAYARPVAAVLRSTAESRPLSNKELYGRKLTEEEFATLCGV